MVSQDDLNAACQTYRGLMVEVKARISSINTLTNDQRGIPSKLVREFGVLQIRMLCEIIGLSCLVAHGDLVERSGQNLKKAYAPGEIFSALMALHDDFFPVPIVPEKTEIGWHIAEYVGKPFASKTEIREIWAKCGEILHRGTLKRLIKEKEPVQNSFSDLNEWGQKISNLLSNHRIISFDRQTTFVTLLAHGEEVQVVIGHVIPETDNS
jgi:hypothetical protein